MKKNIIILISIILCVVFVACDDSMSSSDDITISNAENSINDISANDEIQYEGDQNDYNIDNETESVEEIHDYESMSLIELIARFCNNEQLVDKYVEVTGYLSSPLTKSSEEYSFEMYIVENGNSHGNEAYVRRDNPYGFIIKNKEAEIDVEPRFYITNQIEVDKLKNITVGTQITVRGKIRYVGNVYKDEYDFSGYDSFRGELSLDAIELVE